MKQYDTPQWGKNRDASYETPHVPNAQHRDSLISEHYPTLGMPVIETHFRDQRVTDADLSRFDQSVLNAIKPYQVQSTLFRTLTVSSLDMEGQTMEAISSARISWKTQKHSSTSESKEKISLAVM